MNPKGGFDAEYAAVKAEEVHDPGKLTTRQAGATPVDAMTALRGLDDTLGLKPGESVLILGQRRHRPRRELAKRMRACVRRRFGSDGVALAKRLSADAVIDGHKDDIVAAARQFAPDGLDAALITAGGPAADTALADAPGWTRRLPTVSNPSRSRRLENAKADDGTPTAGDRETNRLSNPRGDRRSRSMSRAAFRSTKPPKHIGHLTRTRRKLLSANGEADGEKG